MTPDEKIYRADCDMISKGELCKRLDIGITYFGNVRNPT